MKINKDNFLEYNGLLAAHISESSSKLSSIPIDDILTTSTSKSGDSYKLLANQLKQMSTNITDIMLKTLEYTTTIHNEFNETDEQQASKFLK